MKSALMGALALAAVIGAPAVSLAATYQYVTTQGEIGEVIADNAAQAMVKPSDIAANSGVMLVTTEAASIPDNAQVSGVR